MGKSGSVIMILMALVLSACGTIATRNALEDIVARDIMPVPDDGIPPEMTARLSQADVLVIGETHQIREHQELLSRLLEALHATGFRQLLLEWPQPEDWLLDAYVTDRFPDLSWSPQRPCGGMVIRSLREFNRTLPADQRFRVHAIDVNHAGYGPFETFIGSIRELAARVKDAWPLADLAANYPNGDPEGQKAALEAVLTLIGDARGRCAQAWGPEWYGVVREMIEVEIASVSIRSDWDRNYDRAFARREEEMKRLVDARLKETPGRTVINVGSYHAQKAHFLGTPHEWLGDYLVHKSPNAAGRTMTLFIGPAHGEINENGTWISFDLLEKSPRNELLRIMSAQAGGRTAFLPLDDPLFAEQRVTVNYIGRLGVWKPKMVYDGFILLPESHRITN